MELMGRVATRLLHLGGRAFERERLEPLLSLLEMSQTCQMVAHTGFEPVISALRGRCPRPLDECALPLSVTL